MSDMRDAFERWAAKEVPHLYLTKEEDTGEYVYKAADIAYRSWQAARAQGGQGVETVVWGFCPECGADDPNEYPDMLKVCKDCGQDWYADVDYTDVIRAKLSKAAAQSQSAAPEHLMARIKNLLNALGHQGTVLNEGEPPYDIGEWGIKEAQELHILLTTHDNAGTGKEQ